ncbi:MAG: DegV family protein, partial [Candidatus Limiplasma sp.]|nr:DegV family protein [Candidatus Limiplasma sp.]
GKVEGMVGSLLQIKPIIYVNDEGIYATLAKTRGYKSAVDTMVAEVKRFLGGARAEVAVVNGKALEEAEKLVERLKGELNGVGETPIMSVSPVLAIHTGPGLLGIVANRMDPV